MSETLQVTKRIHFSMANKGRRQIKRGPQPVRDTPNGRVPRVARLMALALKFDQLIRTQGVYDQSELAEVGHVTRARVTQIMNLLHLAPDIQEQILFLPPVTEGRDPVTERDLRPIAKETDWAEQRRLWAVLCGERYRCSRPGALQHRESLGKHHPFTTAPIGPDHLACSRVHIPCAAGAAAGGPPVVDRTTRRQRNGR